MDNVVRDDFPPLNIPGRARSHHGPDQQAINAIGVNRCTLYQAIAQDWKTCTKCKIKICMVCAKVCHKNHPLADGGMSHLACECGSVGCNALRKSAAQRAGLRDLVTKRRYGFDPKELARFLSYGIFNNMQTHQNMDRHKTVCNGKGKIQNEDFQANLQIAGTQESKKFQFSSYANPVFCCVRKLFGIDSNSFLTSLGPESGQLKGGPSKGKGGAFFYFSGDKKFILKTLTDPECQLFLKLLPDYLSHVRDFTHTLLPRFYGLFRIQHQSRPYWFLCMHNVFNTTRPIDYRFDLKGSSVGRQATEEEKKDKGVILKDLDFDKIMGKVYFGKTNKQIFKMQIQQDVKFLESHGIMDYSLLLGIHAVSQNSQGQLQAESPTTPRNLYKIDSQLKGKLAVSSKKKPKRHSALGPLEKNLQTGISVFQVFDGGIMSKPKSKNQMYFFGIIDVLQRYDTMKILETGAKSLKHNKNEISSVNPRQYAARFQKYINAIVQ